MGLYTFLYKIYFVRFKNKYIDGLYNRLIIRLLNILFPVFFTLDPFKSKLNARTIDKNRELIVSLTTFPLRIKKVWMVVETILRQKVKPDKIVLWLYAGEFDGHQSLPRKLLRLEKQGLEIRFCDENLMPHKKYYYTMLEYPDANVITVDDDIFYPPDFIIKLLKYHHSYPEAIICTIGRKIKIVDNKIYPYKEWEHIKFDSTPLFQTIPIGAGGVLFPARSLPPECFDREKITNNALMNSDLWLKIMSLKAETRVVCIAGEYKKWFIPLLYRNDIKLMETNIGKGRNDRVLKKLMELYNVTAKNFQE